MHILITRPHYDPLTMFLSTWSEDIIKHASTLSHSVIDLFNDDVTKNNTILAIEKNKPSLIFFNGHGDSDRMLGQNDEVIVTDKDPGPLKGANIVYARACDSAKVLGPSLVKAGLKAFIGYKERLWFMVYSNPKVIDQNVKAFIEPTDAIVKSLLDGKDVETANKESLESYQQNRIKLSNSLAAAWLLPLLDHNMSCQSYIGDPKATI